MMPGPTSPTRSSSWLTVQAIAEIQADSSISRPCANLVRGHDLVVVGLFGQVGSDAGAAAQKEEAAAGYGLMSRGCDGRLPARKGLDPATQRRSAVQTAGEKDRAAAAVADATPTRT
jgi:hypothetical protein